ncbi:MAG: universal stress protein [Candidatus Bathyarchaeota archaeon]|nr:MAG: universal stress protein [Candidatus Bathyarchaeota archaeon]
MKSESHLKKILVPVDGSHPCLHAEELVAAIAKNFESKVTVIHVVSHELMQAARKLDYHVPTPVLTEITNWFSQAGRKILWGAEALFKEEGIEVDARIVEYGDPAETILRLAKDEEYDLVVMGNRGETEAEVFSLGSVAEKVSRHAECPVLIVKQKTKLSKILVAIDGSESADKALEHAVQLAKKNKAKMTLLNVQESRIFGLKPEVTKEIGERILSSARAKVRGVEFNTQLESGNLAETIIEIAEKGNYDLIVVGSRGLSGVKRFFLGSISDDVSHHAKCSVLIVR